MPQTKPSGTLACSLLTVHSLVKGLLNAFEALGGLGISPNLRALIITLNRVWGRIYYSSNNEEPPK